MYQVSVRGGKGMCVLQSVSVKRRGNTYMK